MVVNDTRLNCKEPLGIYKLYHSDNDAHRTHTTKDSVKGMDDTVKQILSEDV